jgi:hypothetical protein
MLHSASGSSLRYGSPGQPGEDLVPSRDETLADIQWVGAELRRERDAALEQQTATAEVLPVVNAFSGNLPPVFEKAVRPCGAAILSAATVEVHATQ